MTTNAAQDVATATPKDLAGYTSAHTGWDTPAASARRYDVAIVGASIAGCAAAILLARRDLHVLLIDKKRTHVDYKPTCTTFIQPSALPVIRKLGMQEPLEELGAIRNGAVFWTPYGWIRDPWPKDEAYAHGYSLQRRKLDPAFLETARASNRVTAELGAKLTGLIENAKGAIAGIRYTDHAGVERAAAARLVVFADGRNSTGAELAQVPTRHRENNRFVLFAYYRNMPLRTGDVAQFYQKGRDMGFAYPFDDDLTMLCCFVTQDKYAQWKDRKAEALSSFFEDLPEPPDQRHARRVSKVIGMRRLNDFKRPAVHRGAALIGDACMAMDPMAGVGCGFALQSADWLDQHVGPALAARDDLVRPLQAFKKTHRRRLTGHEYFIQDNSTGRKANLLERVVSKAAVADPYVAHQLHLFIARITDWRQFLSAYNLWRILASSVAYTLNPRRYFRYELP